MLHVMPPVTRLTIRGYLLLSKDGEVCNRWLMPIEWMAVTTCWRHEFNESRCMRSGCVAVMLAAVSRERVGVCKPRIAPSSLCRCTQSPSTVQLAQTQVTVCKDPKPYPA